MTDYPKLVPGRFELRNGKYGPYFHDNNYDYSMPLDMVLGSLNTFELRQQQMAWMVAKYGDPSTAKPLIPNAETIEALEDGRAGRMETVGDGSIDALMAELNEDAANG